MALAPRPAGETPPPDLAAITREVEAFAGGPLPAWEAGYLDYHRRRYQDTLRLLPPGDGRQLLDVGSFPGHLSALARARGWGVTGLNNTIEGASVWADFLARCRGRDIAILGCEVEREPFPLPTGSMDAVLFCELFEHLHVNPFHALKEIFRVLRPGGLLVLTTPNLGRAETLFRYLHGWGFQPPVSRTFRELFPSLLYHRHNREYTAHELDYYLGRQGKDLYDFRLDRVYHSDCLDGDHEIPAVLGQRPGALERVLGRALRRWVPRTRGQLVARAWRPGASLVAWDGLQAAEGFGPLEEDERPVQGFTRRVTFPLRLTGARAALEVPLAAGAGPALVSLMVAHPAPDDAPPLQTRWSIAGTPAMTLALVPSPRAVRVRLLVPEAVASRHAVRIEIETSTWLDAERGREVGLHVGGQWVLVERLSTSEALQAALQRVREERQAEESLGDGWWWPAESLYLPHAPLAPELEMGRGDEAQLGPGWHHREDWGPHGAMRWTGPEADAHLATSGRATVLRVRAYSGEARLGAVSGRLLVAHARPGEPDRAAADATFALAPDTWQVLAIPVPPEPGRLRLRIHVDAARVPRERIPGAGDARPLGLAIKRLWLA